MTDDSSTTGPSAAGTTGLSSAGPGPSASHEGPPKLHPERWRSRKRRRLSKLTLRIMAVNMIALAILVGGVFYLDQFRRGLIDSRILDLRIEGEIIAAALGQAATRGGAEATTIEAARAEPILARLVVPAQIRARLFSADGNLILDSRDLAVGERIVTEKLASVGTFDAFLRRVASKFHRAVDALAQKDKLPLYHEELHPKAASYPEVIHALEGDTDVMLRATAEGSTIITVAVPVQRLRRVLGGLLLSKDTADIDRMVRRERVAILKIFGISFGVTLFLSLFLSRTIAKPIRLLAAAADQVRPGRGRTAKIPDFRRRRDEIGDLSHALTDMKQALFRQLDAVEAFAADVSHELKNPLTSIRSALETINLTKNPEQQRQLLAIIADDVERLNRLITDISAVSRLDAQMSRAQMAPIDLVALLAGLVEVYQATAKPDAPRVRLVLSETVHMMGKLEVMGLDGPLGQVFRNLVDNALSFAPPGSEVVITLRRFGAMAEVAVEDQGIGLPPDKLESIFERFYSERPAGESFGKHSGLGLHISKRIVEAHEGEIAAENILATAEAAPGAAEAPAVVRGACFIVRLPIL